jgi:hypothetical protein
MELGSPQKSQNDLGKLLKTLNFHSASTVVDQRDARLRAVKIASPWPNCLNFHCLTIMVSYLNPMD